MNIPNVVVIGDFFEDLDDEHSLCLAAKLHRDGLINLRCMVANLNPASLRARGAKGTLMQLGLPNVPVGVGTPVDGRTYLLKETDIPYIAAPHEVRDDGLKLLAGMLEACPNKSVTLILQS